MDQSTHAVRRANWLNIITQCKDRPTGTSAKQWLAENGINEKSYYYWLRKIRREACEHLQLPGTSGLSEVSFVEVPLETATTIPASAQNTPVSPSAVIKANGLTLEISNDISELLLARLLQEVLHA